MHEGENDEFIRILDKDSLEIQHETHTSQLSGVLSALNKKKNIILP
jgi:hypothetical protein